MEKAPDFINLNEYTYHLPKDRIAKEPLKNRAGAKLLHYHQGKVSHHTFKNIAEVLPEDAHMVFNNTRVIPARLHFVKDTGALIEVFLLEPIAPVTEVASAMLIKNKCVWRCLIGNLKKWKADQALVKLLDGAISLEAKLLDREKQVVELSWNGSAEFVHVIAAAGKTPLPPYIDREVTLADGERYQTVYSKFEGAVAAPTAGLHFDLDTIDHIKTCGRLIDYVTLHVSAGTFLPVTTANAIEHDMHAEQVVIKKEVVQNLLSRRMTIAVGTTSMRTLESMYWFGVKLLQGKSQFYIEKLFPYSIQDEPSKERALLAVLDFMEDNALDEITGTTEIFIFPGYSFKICEGLITNYHLPASTLILLVAAFIGSSWKNVYEEALTHGYRFLSYGDSSLLVP